MEAVLGKGSTGGRVGLLVSDRMMNCPLQALPKLHESLVEDMEWAVENEISTEHRDKFKYDSYIVVAPCEDANGTAGEGGERAGPRQLSDFYFVRFDDEVLLQEADFFFVMRGVTAVSTGPGPVTGEAQKYVVGVIPAIKYQGCVESIALMAA
ncbi:unnamed protein product [Choristocarpus tenellus]